MLLCCLSEFYCGVFLTNTVFVSARVLDRQAIRGATRHNGEGIGNRYEYLRLLELKVKVFEKMIVQIQNDVDLFFVCSLIDFIGRQTKNDRKVIVNKIGEDGIRHIYNFANVLHSENIEEVADRIINQYDIKKSNF